MIDLVGRRFWYFLASGVVILAGVISLVISGLSWGIDFSSGSSFNLVFEQDVSESDLKEFFKEKGYGEPIVQGGIKEEGYEVTTDSLGPEEEKNLKTALDQEFTAQGYLFFPTSEGFSIIFSHFTPEVEENFKRVCEKTGIVISGIQPREKDAFFIRTKTIGSQEREDLTRELKEEFGPYGFFDFYFVSPAVATDMKRYAGYAVAAACIGIFLYLAFAFRRMPNPFRYGVCAIIALAHDVLVVLGIFSLTGVEVDAWFLTGILAVAGYSVNDTVVVLDRIRENMMTKGGELLSVVNRSLIQTLSRSLNTSITTILLILALFLLGGSTIHNFMLVFLIGIIAGTYSSMFIASMFLVIWERREWRRFFSWLPFVRA
jgi:preprotein translocase subunit SecF